MMTRQWRDPRVDFAGEFWQMVDAAMEPKPFQKPCPRLWFGGGGRTALRRAVLRPGPFAGLLGGGQVSTVKFADQVQIVRQALAEAAGRKVTSRSPSASTSRWTTTPIGWLPRSSQSLGCPG